RCGRGCLRRDRLGRRLRVRSGCIALEVRLDRRAELFAGPSKFAHGATEGSTELGQVLGAEHQERDHEDEDQFLEADVKHSSARSPPDHTTTVPPKAAGEANGWTILRGPCGAAKPLSRGARSTRLVPRTGWEVIVGP